MSRGVLRCDVVDGMVWCCVAVRRVVVRGGAMCCAWLCGVALWCVVLRCDLWWRVAPCRVVLSCVVPCCGVRCCVVL